MSTRQTLSCSSRGAGWAVIEVKGGDVRRHEGAWEQRQKGLWRRIDPVGQAQDCRHVLQRYLARAWLVSRAQSCGAPCRAAGA